MACFSMRLTLFSERVSMQPECGILRSSRACDWGFAIILSRQMTLSCEYVWMAPRNPTQYRPFLLATIAGSKASSLRLLSGVGGFAPNERVYLSLVEHNMKLGLARFE